MWNLIQTRSMIVQRRIEGRETNEDHAIEHTVCEIEWVQASVGADSLQEERSLFVYPFWPSEGRSHSVNTFKICSKKRWWLSFNAASHILLAIDYSINTTPTSCQSHLSQQTNCWVIIIMEGVIPIENTKEPYPLRDKGMDQWNL